MACASGDQTTRSSHAVATRFAATSLLDSPCCVSTVCCPDPLHALGFVQTTPQKQLTSDPKPPNPSVVPTTATADDARARQMASGARLKTVISLSGLPGEQLVTIVMVTPIKEIKISFMLGMEFDLPKPGPPG